MKISESIGGSEPQARNAGLQCMFRAATDIFHTLEATSATITSGTGPVSELPSAAESDIVQGNRKESLPKRAFFSL